MLSFVKSAWAIPLLGPTLAGCLLPDFENGPAPESTAQHVDGSVDGSLDGDAALPLDAPSPQDAMQGEDSIIDAPSSSDVPEDIDVGDLDAGFCQTHPDGTVCGTGDACHEMLCDAGQCLPSAIPDGVECAPAPNPCWNAGKCQGGVCGPATPLADGASWDPSDTWRRCCGGEALRMDTNANCGVCGIQCDPADGQSCTLNAANERYYCEGCHASAKCWSGCCSMAYGSPYRCAASDCSGHCIDCPGDSTCISSPGEASLVCGYQ